MRAPGIAVNLASTWLLSVLSLAHPAAHAVPADLSPAGGLHSDSAAVHRLSDAFAAPPPPPSTLGEPNRRADGGSRSCQQMSAEVNPLTALVPVYQPGDSTVVFGKTIAEHPSLWFYVPQHAPATGTFVIRDQAEKLIYEAAVTLPDQPGIIRISLPSGIAGLEVGQPYHWYFKVYCRSVSPPDAFVDGWIQRDTLPATLQQQLGSATLSERISLYAEQGLWFDALTAAAALKQSAPDDLNWVALLQAAGLTDMVTEPIAK